MDAIEADKALVAWAMDTCSELSNGYDHDPNQIVDALPIVTASVSEEAVVASDPTLGLAIAEIGLDQAPLHVMRSTLLLMVAPEPADAADDQLKAFVAKLAASLKGDQTLGGRVPSASPYWRAPYDPPYVEFDDGTKGRAAYFSLAIAELV